MKFPWKVRGARFINEAIHLRGQKFSFCAATVAIRIACCPLPKISADLARQLGPLLETHLRFPKRINVQLMKVLDRANIQIEIWERGAGYTLASGSSSSAAASVAHKLGLCDRSITVPHARGQIQIEIGEDFMIVMTAR